MHQPFLMCNICVGCVRQRRRILHVSYKCLQNVVLKLPPYCLSQFESSLQNPTKFYKNREKNLYKLNAAGKTWAGKL